MTATTETTAPAALDFAQLLKKTAPEKDHVVCLDGAARTRLLEAEVKLAEAKRVVEQQKDAIAARHGETYAGSLVAAPSPPLPEARYLEAIVDAEKAVEEAIAEARRHSITLRLRGLGDADYDELVSEWGPSDDQTAKAKAKDLPEPAFDPDEFRPALIARCVVNMKMTQEQAKQLWHSPGWNSRDLLDLFYACQDVCAIGGHVDLGNGSSSTRSSGPSSTGASAKRTSRTATS